MNDAAACWHAAQAALARRDVADAARQLQQLLQLAPGHAYARVLLAGTQLASGQLRAAAVQLCEATHHVGDDVAVLARLAQALLRVGEHRVLRDLLRQPAIATCRDGALLATLAHVQQSLGQHAEALALMRQAQACGFDTPEFHYFLAVQLQFNGQLDEAAQALDVALRQAPGHGRAALTRARLRRQRVDDHHVGALRQQLARAPAGSEDQAALAFALYKELEDLGEHAAAWSALQQGNAVMHARLRHDGDAEASRYRVLGELAAQGVFAAGDAGAATTPASGPQPIFIVGLPRSGTTLLERMLGNHSQIVSAGELGDFGQQLRWVADQPGRTLLDAPLLAALPALDYATLGRRYLAQTQWRAGAQRWFIDKLPANYQLVGPIACALPGAVVVHLRREPMAVCFSNYRALFGDAYAYSYHLQTLAQHHRAYDALMAQWRQALPERLLEIDYRELVQAPDAVLRQVLARCALAPEPGQTDITRNAAASATLSSVQVREGVHTRNLETWRPYAAQLQPLRNALGLPAEA